MDPKRKRILIAVLLILAITNYSRIVSAGNIRTVEFLTIFAIGALSALLINEIACAIKKK